MCYCLTSSCQYDIFAILDFKNCFCLSTFQLHFVYMYFFFVEKKKNRGGKVEKQIERMKSRVEWVSQCFFPVNFDSTFHNNTQCIILTKYCYVIYSKIIRYLRKNIFLILSHQLIDLEKSYAMKEDQRQKSVSLQVMKEPFSRI